MTTQLAPGDVGIDYSGARPAPSSTRNAGGRFIVRYSAGVGNDQPATQWKLCEVGEIQAAVDAGMDFIANSEWYESRITEGAAAGLADGTADLEFWRSRGLAKGASIYVSFDTSPTGALTRRRAIQYLKAYGTGLGGYYQVDCYAGTPFLKQAIAKKAIRYGWRPNAGSWSNDGLPYQPSKLTAALLDQARAVTPAAVWQTGNYWHGKSADENVILRVPVGSHLESLNAAQEDDVQQMTPRERAQLVADIAAAVRDQPLTAHDGTPTTFGRAVVAGSRHAFHADHALNADNGVLARVAVVQRAVGQLKLGPVDVGALATAVVTRIGSILGGGE